MKSRDKKKNSIKKTVIVMAFLALVIVAFYFIVSRKSAPDDDNSTENKTEVQKLLDKDINANFPGSPRETLKLYSRIIKCLYNEDMSDEQLKNMASQIRVLFDDELLKNNPEEEYMDRLKKEIAAYKKVNKIILSYVIQNYSAIEFNTVDDIEYATILANYTVKKKNDFSQTIEEFMLRKDENGNWKILGWKLSDSVEVEGEDY